MKTCKNLVKTTFNSLARLNKPLLISGLIVSSLALQSCGGGGGGGGGNKPAPAGNRKLTIHAKFAQSTSDSITHYIRIDAHSCGKVMVDGKEVVGGNFRIDNTFGTGADITKTLTYSAASQCLFIKVGMQPTSAGTSQPSIKVNLNPNTGEIKTEQEGTIQDGINQGEWQGFYETVAIEKNKLTFTESPNQKIKVKNNSSKNIITDVKNGSMTCFKGLHQESFISKADEGSLTLNTEHCTGGFLFSTDSKQDNCSIDFVGGSTKMSSGTCLTGSSDSGVKWIWDSGKKRLEFTDGAAPSTGKLLTGINLSNDETGSDGYTESNESCKSAVQPADLNFTTVTAWQRFNGYFQFQEDPTSAVCIVPGKNDLLAAVATGANFGNPHKGCSDAVNSKYKLPAMHLCQQLSGASTNMSILPSQFFSVVVPTKWWTQNDQSLPTAGATPSFHSIGMKLIRLPFRIDYLFPKTSSPTASCPKADFTDVNQAYLTNLQKQIKDILAHPDVSLILDNHSYLRWNPNKGLDEGNCIVSKDDMKTMWSKTIVQLTTKGKNALPVNGGYVENSRLWFELANEPHDPSASEVAKAMDGGIQGIRGVGAQAANAVYKNKIIVDGTAYSGLSSWSGSSGNNDSFPTILMAGDKNIAYDMHQYFDKTYAGAWGYQQGCPSGDELSEQYADTYSWMIANHAQVIVGEFGWPSTSGWSRVNTDRHNHKTPQGQPDPLKPLPNDLMENCTDRATTLLNFMQKYAVQVNPDKAGDGGFIGWTYWATGAPSILDYSGLDTANSSNDSDQLKTLQPFITANK